MTLTPKQEAFCLAYIETGNASEAYRVAYDASKMKPATINRKAKVELDKGKIRARIDELRKPVVEAAQVTLADHLKALKELRDAALAVNQFGPAVTAEVSRGKASGLYTDKHEHSGPNGSAIPTKITLEFVDPK